MTQQKFYRSEQTPAQRTFAEYVRFITADVVENFGSSYMTADTVRNSWRAEIGYSHKMADHIILQTRTFIRLLQKDRNGAAENPQFLLALTKLMSDYLSAYFMHNPEIPTRKKAKQKLQAALYDNFDYIQKLLANQAISRKNRKTNHFERADRRKSIERARKKYDAAIAGQVRGIFAEAARYCR